MRRLIFLTTVAGAAAALLLAAVALHQSSASAQPIAGATYTGTVSGDGSIEFTVSDDGASIEELTIASEDCGPFLHDPSSPFDPWPVASDIPIVDAEFTCEKSNWSLAIASPSCTLACSGLSFSFTGSFPSPGEAEGSFSFGSAPSPCNFGESTWSATSAAVPTPTPTPTPTPVPEEGKLENCPHPGKWAIAVWNGDDGTDAEQAFVTCDEGGVAVDYSIDPDTQLWSRWFADRPDVSNLTTLDDMQCLMALGGEAP